MRLLQSQYDSALNPDHLEWQDMEPWDKQTIQLADKVEFLCDDDTWAPTPEGVMFHDDWAYRITPDESLVEGYKYVPPIKGLKFRKSDGVLWIDFSHKGRHACIRATEFVERMTEHGEFASILSSWIESNLPKDEREGVAMGILDHCIASIRIKHDK